MLNFFSVLIFLSQLMTTSAFAKADLNGFMSSRDLLNNESTSNISLQNNKNSTATVYGLYVNQYAYVAPGESCNNATVIYPSTNNKAAGAFVTPAVIKAGGKAVVGSNYLYNMIYAAIYYENIIITSSPPGCALPGCTWGSDTAKYNWCIYLGALAPVSTSAGYTANVPPATEDVSSSSLYNYNLVTHYNYVGPITCNDKTLTCSTSNSQTQSFS